jgi:hypothetical protein
MKGGNEAEELEELKVGQGVSSTKNRQAHHIKQIK